MENFIDIDVSISFELQGASRDGSTPDGTSYLQAAEREDIRNLLR